MRPGYKNKYGPWTFVCAEPGCKARVVCYVDKRSAMAQGWQILHPIRCPAHNPDHKAKS